MPALQRVPVEHIEVRIHRNGQIFRFLPCQKLGDQVCGNPALLLKSHDPAADDAMSQVSIRNTKNRRVGSFSDHRKGFRRVDELASRSILKKGDVKHDGIPGKLAQAFQQAARLEVRKVDEVELGGNRGKICLR